MRRIGRRLHAARRRPGADPCVRSPTCRAKCASRRRSHTSGADGVRTGLVALPVRVTPMQAGDRGVQQKLRPRPQEWAELYQRITGGIAPDPVDIDPIPRRDTQAAQLRHEVFQSQIGKGAGEFLMVQGPDVSREPGIRGLVLGSGGQQGEPATGRPGRSESRQPQGRCRQSREMPPVHVTLRKQDDAPDATTGQRPSGSGWLPPPPETGRSPRRTGSGPHAGGLGRR